MPVDLPSGVHLGLHMSVSAMMKDIRPSSWTPAHSIMSVVWPVHQFTEQEGDLLVLPAFRTTDLKHSNLRVYEMKESKNVSRRNKLET